MIGRTMVAMAVAALALCPASGLAAGDMKLAIEDYSEAAEIRVALPAAVREHPALYEEMVRTAQPAMAAFRAEAEAAARAAGQDAGAAWNPWSLDYVYEPRYLGPLYASFLVDVITYRGGAYPTLDYEVINRDLEVNDPVVLADMFVDAGEGSPALRAIAAFVTQEVARQKEERSGLPFDRATADWLDAVAPRPENFRLFTFEPATQEGLVAGLSFHFPSGSLGGSAEGPYEVFVPADIFANELAGYFPQIFGGDPVSVVRLSSYEDPGTFVFLQSPRPDAAAASPVRVEGEVPADWFDGGTVSLRVEDMEGNVLGEAAAEPHPAAPRFNITSGMMPFSASISFEAGEAEEGQLVIAPPEGHGSEVTAFLSFQ